MPQKLHLEASTENTLIRTLHRPNRMQNINISGQIVNYVPHSATAEDITTSDAAKNDMPLFRQIAPQRRPIRKSYVILVAFYICLCYNI
jgi:hypothetical protein